MFRKGISVLLAGICVLVVSGCATGRKQMNTQMQGLKDQVARLEAEVQQKDVEISELKDTLIRVSNEKDTLQRSSPMGSVEEVKSRPSTKQIQIALKNAGYDPGVVDGRMGRKTREAIKAFQKRHDLVADGRVGKRTWTALKSYLETRVK